MNSLAMDGLIISGFPRAASACPRSVRQLGQGGREACRPVAATAVSGRAVAGFRACAIPAGLVAGASPPHAGVLLETTLTFVLTILISAASLLRGRPTRRPARLAVEIETAPFQVLQNLRSGRVTGYVVWMMVGLAVLAGLLKSG